MNWKGIQNDFQVTCLKIRRSRRPETQGIPGTLDDTSDGIDAGRWSSDGGRCVLFGSFALPSNYVITEKLRLTLYT